MWVYGGTLFGVGVYSSTPPTFQTRMAQFLMESRQFSVFSRNGNEIYTSVGLRQLVVKAE